ncbi:MAG: glycosyltransferase family 4 protein [Chlorobiaceae bacterium]|nr:glycosyltransferase family 4 protein [Chlorobiaceae bacterium]
MKLSYDILKGKGYSGNLVYTHELLKALTSEYPEHQYHLMINWSRKQEAQQEFGAKPCLQYHNILPSNLVLGRQFEKTVRYINKRLLIAATKKYDIYHATNPTHFPNGIKNGIITLHDLIPLRDDSWVGEGTKTFYKKHIHSILKQAKLILCVSSFTEQEALNNFPDIAGKTLVTPLAAGACYKQEPGHRDFLKKYRIHDSNKPYLLYVGEIQPRKNIESILQAFDSLPPGIRASLQLIIIGSARTAINQSRFTAALNGLRNKQDIFHLTNIPTKDLIRFYNGAHLFIFPSFFEGFGLPVIEAMSCGCPVITSSTSSLQEVAADAALTIDPHNCGELRQAILELIENDELRTHYREKGLQRSSTFSWKRTAKETINGYRQISS